LFLQIISVLKFICKVDLIPFQYDLQILSVISANNFCVEVHLQSRFNSISIRFTNSKEKRNVEQKEKLIKISRIRQSHRSRLLFEFKE
ncbi:hypothetical protein Bhyg_03609, partial [Pseudolycoriella hygida]